MILLKQIYNTIKITLREDQMINYCSLASTGPFSSTVPPKPSPYLPPPSCILIHWSCLHRSWLSPKPSTGWDSQARLEVGIKLESHVQGEEEDPEQVCKEEQEMNHQNLVKNILMNNNQDHYWVLTAGRWLVMPGKH